MVLFLLACQGPFDVRRKDLGPFRIAAIGVQDGLARAAVWSGEGMFHSHTPSLRWTLDGETLGEGFEVEVSESGLLGLEVENAEGELLFAEVMVASPPALPGFERLAVDIDDLDLAARRQAQESELSGPSLAVRVRLDSIEGVEARWMSALGEGTLLELEPFAADVLAEEVLFEDGVAVDRAPTEAGIYHQLVLLMDGEGGNNWIWIDVPLGLDSGGLVAHHGRLISGEPGLMGATIGPAGELLELSPAELEEHDASCGPAPFELAWLVEGRCGLDTVQGQRVVFETW